MSISGAMPSLFPIDDITPNCATIVPSPEGATDRPAVMGGKIMMKQLTGALACGVCIVAMATPANAQSRTYNIPAGSLKTALEQYRTQSGRPIIYKADQLRGARSGGVSGAMSADAALEAILAGTLFRAKADSSGAVAIVHVGNGQGTSGDARPSATVSEAGDGQDIVVTAQRRSEPLQRVPISASVASGKDLDRSNYQGISEVLSTVPGVAISNAFQGGGTQLSIRGVSAGAPLFGGSSAVAYYLDAVPFGLLKSTFTPDSNPYDLQRVEVLRGPQGTLYGSSALNGVVRVLTNDADPTAFDFKARASGSRTDKGGFNYRGDMAVNVPLVQDSLAVRATLGYQNDSGWIDSPNKSNVNGDHLFSGRFKITAKPTDRLTLNGSVWISRTHYDAPSIGDRQDFNTSTLSQPINTDFDSYSLTAGYDLGFARLTSSTSFLRFNNGSLLDLRPITFPLTLFTGLKANVFTQEVSLNSQGDGPWRWSIGGIYRNDRERDDQSYAELPGDTVYRQTSKSYALYGEITRLLFDDRIELTGGLRYFHDQQSFASVQAGDPTVIPNGATFSATTPRFVLSWHPDQKNTLYASYSQGFRSGSPQLPPVPTTYPAAGPDKLTNYEVGAKGSILPHLSYNFAAYYIRWKGVQQQLTVPISVGGNNLPFSVIVNGANATGPGIDASVTTDFIQNLRLTASLSWNNLTLDSPVVSGGQILFRKGERLDFSPKYTAGVSADYVVPVSNDLRGHLFISGNYTSSQTTRDLGANGAIVQRGDTVFVGRARVSLESERGWTASVFVDNFTNERPSPLISGLTASTNNDYDTRIRPRTAGLQLEFHLRP
jgi:iron complex outermembrane recepter protein